MEEVDKIIIQSLISVGCSIDQEVKSIEQFDNDLFIESIATLLNTINAVSSGETLPTKLPPNTGVKFRICSKFATVCQQIGYKNEVGYQTFLYSNATEMRRLLIFLVEKLTKESAANQSGVEQADSTPGGSGKNKSKNLKLQISQKIKSSLNQFWLPPYCKLNGLRVQENDSLEKESCKYIDNLNTISLAIPTNYSNTAKSKFSKDIEHYLERYSKLITNQALRRPVDVLTSVLEINTLNRIKEQSLLKSELNTSMDESKKVSKMEALKALKQVLKGSLKEAERISKEKSSNTLSKSDLVDIENDLQQLSARNLITKGSRFTHSEKLQFTQEEEKGISIISGATEEKKEDQIQNYKDKLEELNKAYEELEADALSLRNSIESAEKSCLDQIDLNKIFEESIQVKKRTINLINDAPMNILRLNEEINNHENKMLSLKNQWNNVKKPLENEGSKLKDQIVNNNLKLNQKLEEIKLMRAEIDELNADLTEKEDLLAELNREQEKEAKDAGKISNRQFYTKRILEIVSSIDKQKKEIDKILIETKAIQKEINVLTGKLERVFNSTDELIFKDAKKDETNKKVYKLFVNINENYDNLIKTIERSSHVNREIRDMEDQVNAELQSKISDNLEKLMKDYKQIKEENEQLAKINK